MNPRYRLAPEYLWVRCQSACKKALHAGACRLASGQLAANATDADLQDQHAQLSAARRAMPQFEADMTTAESFTGGVAATVRGGKKYWRQAFIQASQPYP